MNARNTSPRLGVILSACLPLALAGCNREAPPEYMPLPPPTTEALPAAPAVAGQVPPAAANEPLTIARACASDIERFCAGVPPRQGMIKGCMSSHLTELSAGCFDAVMGAIAAEQAP